MSIRIDIIFFVIITRYHTISIIIPILVQSHLDMSHNNHISISHANSGQIVVSHATKNLLMACFSVSIVLSLFNILIQSCFCMIV